MGKVPSDKELNIPKTLFKLEIIEFYGLEQSYHQEVRNLIKSQLNTNETVKEWLMRSTNRQDEIKEKNLNKNMLEDKYDCQIEFVTISSASPIPYIGLQLNHGTVTSNPDALGFFTIEHERHCDVTELYCFIGNVYTPSLYRGLLQ